MPERHSDEIRFVDANTTVETTLGNAIATGDCVMASDMVIVGPVRISFDAQASGSAKHIRAVDVTAFWASAEGQPVAGKQGCYIFALRAAKGFTPWYVGKATKSMKQECFTSHKLKHYNAVLFKGYKGTPVMFFVVLPGNKKKIGAKIITDMEKFLTQTAVSKNSKLSNVQNTKNLPAWTIKGVLRAGRGKPSIPALSFKTMMKM